ncbi:MAG: NAD(P)-binding domain-containing protein [Spirosomataceae bacterium]
MKKGSITESIRNYLKLIALFLHGREHRNWRDSFPISEVKANRSEALQYYRKVAGYYHLHFKLFTEVTHVAKVDETFEIYTTTGHTYWARKVVIATGYFDFPRQLGIEG